MNNQTPKHKQLYEQRMPNQLRLQSMQIEKVMDAHQLTAEVAGGEVSRDHVRFDLQTRMAAGWDKLRALKDDLLSVLGVGDVQLLRENGRFHLEITRPEDVPAPLLPLLNYVETLPPCAAPIGLTEDGEPILLELLGENLTHVHISGDTGAGKSTLLRTLAVALALNNRQSALQMALLAPVGEDGVVDATLAPLNYLPHLLEPLATTAVDSLAILDFLVQEARYRLEQTITYPTIVVFIDEASRLLEADAEKASAALQYLAQQGMRAGICLVVSSTDTDLAALGAVFRSCVSVRIVGYVADEETFHGSAAVVSHDLHPSYLTPGGEFFAISGDMVTVFQAASIGDYDLHLVLDTLHRQRAPALLAHPVAATATAVVDLEDVASADDAEEEAIPFLIKDGDVTYDIRPQAAYASQAWDEEDEVEEEEEQEEDAADFEPDPDFDEYLDQDDDDDDDRIPFEAGIL